MKTRVLFVDDDMRILLALRRMLFRMRSEWDMRFASNAREALDRLAEEPADAVISDEMMNGMGGRSLLDIVRKLYPGTACMILSGQVDPLTRMTSPYRIIEKPCDGETLREMISGALEQNRPREAYYG